jgi:peptidoglycan hydrolase-like protein with peptidoglycan-binding domain
MALLVVVVSLPLGALASINRPLTVGSSGPDVVELQDFLKTQGYFNYPTSTGFFGSVTWKAVAAYQAANGLEAVGNVGPKTRVLINSLVSNTTPSTPANPLTPPSTKPIFYTATGEATTTDPWLAIVAQMNKTAPTGNYTPGFGGAPAPVQNNSEDTVTSDEPQELGFADFTTGTYRVNGNSVAVGGFVVEDAGADWSAFDPNTAITSEGLTGGPIFAPALEALLLADGFTVVGTLKKVGENGYASISAYDSPNYTKIWSFNAAYDDGVNGSTSGVSAVEGLVTQAALDTDDQIITFAATIAPGRVSMSVHGGEVVTDTTGDEVNWNNIGLNIITSRLQTLTLYPVQDDSELIELSTP